MKEQEIRDLKRIACVQEVRVQLFQQQAKEAQQKRTQLEKTIKYLNTKPPFTPMTKKNEYDDNIKGLAGELVGFGVPAGMVGKVMVAVVKATGREWEGDIPTKQTIINHTALCAAITDVITIERIIERKKTCLVHDTTSRKFITYGALLASTSATQATRLLDIIIPEKKGSKGVVDQIVGKTQKYFDWLLRVMTDTGDCS